VVTMTTCGFLLRDHVIEIAGQPSGHNLGTIFLGIYLVVKVHPLLVDITDGYQG
jgi:hypothetical protein